MRVSATGIRWNRTSSPRTSCFRGLAGRDPLHRALVLLIDEITGSRSRPRRSCSRFCRTGRCLPELGTIRAVEIPFVVLTSNSTRELSEALKRRCLFLPMDYPSVQRERDIILSRVPGIDEAFAEQSLASSFRSSRST